MSSTSNGSFDQIIQSNYTEREVKVMNDLTVDTDQPMPRVTPGEGGAFGLASLLIGTGLLADLHLWVQLACIGGGVLLGCVGAFTTGRIRAARNEAVASVAVAENELAQAIVMSEMDHG